MRTQTEREAGRVFRRTWRPFRCPQCGKRKLDRRRRRGAPRRFCGPECKRKWHAVDERRTDHELTIRVPRRLCNRADGCGYCNGIRTIMETAAR